MKPTASSHTLGHLLAGSDGDKTGYRFYEEPIRNLLEAMDRGVCPWNNPCLTWPIANAKTRQPYRGFNQFSLAMATMLANYRSPYWLTLYQANEFGGAVNKGSRSTIIVYRKQFEVGKKESDPKSNLEAPEPGEDKPRTFSRLFYFRVFNFDQTANVDIGVDPYPTVQRKPLQGGTDSAARGIIAGFRDGPKIEHSQSIVDRAAGSYSATRDIVSLRPPEDYVSTGEYWGALFHELIHSCGAPKRLDFSKGKPQQRFGDKEYALEELTCEIGANLLLERADLENEALRENSAAYLRSWRKKIGENPRLLVWAADRAARAVNLILGVAPVAAKPDLAAASALSADAPALSSMPLPSVEAMGVELSAEKPGLHPAVEPSIAG
jgi:antirestriction protein ArdC